MKKAYITPATESFIMTFEGMLAASSKADGVSIGNGSTTITSESGFNSGKKEWGNDIWSNME